MQDIEIKTCHNKWTDESHGMKKSDRFWCSNCDAHSRCKIGYLISGRDMEVVEPNYCPKCGTKVKH